MNYLNKTFSIGLGSNEYRDHWDSIFLRCPTCHGRRDENALCSNAFHVVCDEKGHVVRDYRKA